MTDLDKLEAAINSCENETQLGGLLSTINFQDKHPEYALAVLQKMNAHLAAQRQAPEDRAALAALDFILDSIKYEGIDHAPELKAIETIRAALANSVPGEVLEKISQIVDTSRKWKYATGKPVTSYADDLIAIEEIANSILRDLAPWVKGVGK